MSSVAGPSNKTPSGPVNGASKHPSPLLKKRSKTVHLEDSDGEHSPSHAVTNGRANFNGVNGSKKRRKSHGVGPDPGLLKQRQELPIWKGKESLVQAIKENDTVVILGETGSGKTTQVPQFILDSDQFGSGLIGITQPRKVAAISLATRVAAEQGTNVGGRVGYAVRFDEKSSPETRIKYLTDGMIVRELLSDKLLSRYSVVIVDEAHERTLRTDMLLSALKGIQKERNHPATSVGTNDAKGKGTAGKTQSKPLKVVIMSATLDAERFSKFFNNAKILYIQGRQHPVKILYTQEPQEDYVESALKTFYQIHLQKEPGDVLIFLSGQEEIESLAKSIQMYADQISPSAQQVLICPLYAALPPHAQVRIFAPAPPNTRKVILATNIAETSITIPGIRYVVDTGVCKEKGYVAGRGNGSGIDMLLVKPVSKSSAQQRAGRAGREAPGLCFRLYTEPAFSAFQESAIPEIQRCDLTFAVLQLKCLGQDPETTEFMDAPSAETIRSSLLILFGLEALDRTGAVTSLGRKMSHFPLSPTLSRALLASSSPDLACTAELITVLSVLSATSKLLHEPPSSNSDVRDAVVEMRAKFKHATGDHLMILNVVNAHDQIRAQSGVGGAKEWCKKHFVNERALKEAGEIAKQLKRSCASVGIDPEASCGDQSEKVLRCLLRGFFQHTAIIQPDGTYRQTFGRMPVKIHPSSTLFMHKVPGIMYDELVLTSGTYARTVSTIQQSWLLEVPILGSRSA